MLPRYRWPAAVQNPGSMAGRTGKTRHSIKSADRYSFPQTTVVRCSRNFLRIEVTRREKVQFLGSGFTLEPAIHQVIALDAATGRPKWNYTAPSGAGYSGLLSTEGGLVFGASGGVCFALDADTGREIWRVSLGGDTKSAPISFMVDGRQVIALAAGHALFVFGL